MKKRLFILTAIFCALLAVAAWVVWSNLSVETTVYDIITEKIPSGFDGYRIAQISDLHNYEYGDGNSVLLDILKEQEPDIIVITGDLVDQRKTDIDISVDFVKNAVKIAPCYYVTGNHEYFISDELKVLETKLNDAGAVVLRNECAVLESGGDSVQIIGVDDPLFIQRETKGKFNSAEAMNSQITDVEDKVDYKILLSHRPELFDVYVKNGIDLVFSGHAHGGQVRLPVIGGLYAPHQGKFPQYDAGVYTKEDTSMILSRGLGNSIMPVRVNNRPEVVIAVMHKK